MALSVASSVRIFAMKIFALVLLSLCFCTLISGESSFAKRYEQKYKKYVNAKEEDVKKPVGGFPYVNPTYGIPWPMPQQMTLGSVNLSATSDQLKFSTDYQCDILGQAITRYQKLIFTNNASGDNMNGFGGAFKTRPTTTNTVFTTLQIVVDQPCEKYPYLGMNENCEFFIILLFTSVIVQCVLCYRYVISLGQRHWFVARWCNLGCIAWVRKFQSYVFHTGSD